MSKNLNYKKIYKDIISSRKSLLISREGSGKSKFAEFLVNNLRKVIFLTATNKQAEEKYISFTKLGLNAQLVQSRHYKLKELGISPIFKNRNSPFEPIQIDEEKTIKYLEKHFGQDASKIWLQTRTDEFCLDSNIQIICSTFAQKWQISSFSSNSHLVIFDDPGRAQVCDFLLVDDQKVHEYEKTNTEITQKEVIPGTVKFFIRRPDEFTLDYGIKLPILFTTTEELTSGMITKNLGANLLDCRENNLDGNIFLFSTYSTRKKHDFLIPFFGKYLEKKGLPNVIIGDGMNINEFNHTNSKGNNQLMDVPTIIELSWPATNRTFELLVEFPDKTQRELEEMLLLDTLHQALGRNQGYRNRGKTAYVLCDHQFASAISNKLAYKHIFLRNQKERMNFKTDDKIYWHIHRFLTKPINLMFEFDYKNKTVLYNLVNEMELTSTEIAELIMSLSDRLGKLNNPAINKTIEDLLKKINKGSLTRIETTKSLKPNDKKYKLLKPNDKKSH